MTMDQDRTEKIAAELERRRETEIDTEARRLLRMRENWIRHFAEKWVKLCEENRFLQDALDAAIADSEYYRKVAQEHGADVL